MENFDEKAILLLIESQKKTGEISNINSYCDFFDSIESFVLENKFDLAKKSLDFASSFQTKQGNFQFKKIVAKESVDNGSVNPIFYLNALNLYFSNILDKKDILKFKREIKRSLDYLEAHFDKTYILFYELDRNGVKKISAYENMLFLSFAEEFSDMLNQYDLNKEADKLYLLKTKVDLGVRRYFFNREKRVTISWFKPEIFKYKVASKKELVKLLLIYDFDDNLFNKAVFKQIKLEIKSEVNFEYILLILIYLKSKKDKDFLKLSKLFENYFSFFPKKIMFESEYNLSIKKSIFPQFVEDVKKFEKEKKVIINLNQIRIANLLIKLKSLK